MEYNIAIPSGLLDRILGRRSTLQALRCLFAEREALTGREIARRTGLSHLAAHKALADLALQGIVERRSAPPTYLFKPNRGHWVCSDILAPMFSMEAGWLERLEMLLSRGAPSSVE
jgi:predicted transcriptional regulator